MLSMVVCLNIFDEMTSGATFKHFFNYGPTFRLTPESASHESFKTYSLTKWVDMKEAVSGYGLKLGFQKVS